MAQICSLLARNTLFLGATICVSFGAALPAVVSGDGHYLALTDSGAIYSWGRNDFGQLGHGGKVSSGWSGAPTSPAIVAPPKGQSWANVAAGDNHSLAIASDGSLWAWGRDDLNQLGFRISIARRWIAGGSLESCPVQISSDKDWSSVSGGMLASIALKRDGSLWGWGGNWTGQLGDGQKRPLIEFNPPFEQLPQFPRLTRIGRDNDWIAICAGAQHVLAQKRDGTLWAWGRNDCGQLGLGTFVSTNRPMRIGADTDWVAFAAGGVGRNGAHSAAIKRDGSLWVWGNWKRARLIKGVANPADTNLAPRPARLGTDSNWVRVACGNEIGAALKSDGTLWIWGTNSSGRAPGIVLPTSDAALMQVGLDRDWTNVAIDGVGLGGEGTIHALKADGTLWSWDPQIIATTASINSPTPASGGFPHQILALRKVVPEGADPTRVESSVH